MKDSVYYRDYTRKKIKGIFKDYKQSVMLALLKLKRGPNTVVPITDINAIGSVGASPLAVFNSNLPGPEDIDEIIDEAEDTISYDQTPK